MFDKLELVNNVHLYIDETIDVNILTENLGEKQGELERTEYVHLAL